MNKITDESIIDIMYNKYNIEEHIDCEIKKELVLYKFDKGEYFCREGEQLEYLHFMVEGTIKVNVSLENGKSRLLCFLQDFEILGHLEFFANTDYTSDVLAITDVYCFALDLRKFSSVLFNDTKFLQYSVIKVAKSLLINNENSSFNLLYQLDVRLATYIVLTANDDIFQDNLTVVAEQLATSYRHLTRVLAKFCNKGILEKKYNYYIIVNPKLLKSLSNKSILHM